MTNKTWWQLQSDDLKSNDPANTVRSLLQMLKRLQKATESAGQVSTDDGK